MHTYESLTVGDTYRAERHLTADDVQTFADITGDDNPIHIDPDYAAATRFGGPIVHGVLLLGIVSKVLGRDFPGAGSVAVNISCRFLRPVLVGTTITVEARVAEKVERHEHIRMKIAVYTENNKLALGGDATLIPPSDDA